jgi:ribosomal protein S18 acetylase RimI-like enzyme
MAALTLCRPEDAERLADLMARFAAEYGLAGRDEARNTAVQPLLEGSPYGAAYLFGPPRAPTGYLVVTFGWSIELGGMEAWIDEIYVRTAVRGRGLATEALFALARALREAGVAAIHLEVDRDDPAAQNLYRKCGFALRDRYSLMTLPL